MGLTAPSHLASIGLELSSMLAAGFIAGVVLGWAGVRLVYAKLDILSNLPPPPLFRFAGLVVAAAATFLFLLSIAGSWLVQSIAARANVAEVMRVGQ